jgi:hypothetical protein
MRQRLFLLILLLSLTASQMHEYYLSVARLEYDEKAEDFEMSVWFFADDISLCLSDRSGLEIDWQERQISLADSLLNDYLSERLYLIDGQDRMRPMELMGTQQDGELIRAFLRLHAPEASDFRVQFLALTERFDSQRNLLHFKRGKAKTTLYFKKESEAQALQP